MPAKLYAKLKVFAKADIIEGAKIPKIPCPEKLDVNVPIKIGDGKMIPKPTPTPGPVVAPASIVFTITDVVLYVTNALAVADAN
jgi:hypothetical protein